MPPAVTASLGRGDRAAGSHEGSLTDSPLQTSSVPSSSPEDTGKHHPGWRVPRAEAPSSSAGAGAYRALRRTGPNAAPRTHMGSPVWTASNHFTTTSPGREQGGHERAGCPGQGPARAARSRNAGCTICPFLRMATHPSPPHPWQDSGMLPKAGCGLILCQDEPRRALPTQDGRPRAPRGSSTLQSMPRKLGKHLLGRPAPCGSLAMQLPKPDPPRGSPCPSAWDRPFTNAARAQPKPA